MGREGPDVERDRRIQKKSQARVVKQLLEKMEAKLGGRNVKATLGDYIRLMQLQRELEEEEPKEIKVTWVEPRTRGNRVLAAAVAEAVPRFGGKVQGIFGADRIGEKPGAVPGSDQAELLESGADGADWGSDVSGGCESDDLQPGDQLIRRASGPRRRSIA